MACRMRRVMSSVGASTDSATRWTCLRIKAPRLQNLLEKTMQPNAGCFTIAPFPPHLIPIGLWVDCNSCLKMASRHTNVTARSVSADVDGFPDEIKSTLNPKLITMPCRVVASSLRAWRMTAFCSNRGQLRLWTAWMRGTALALAPQVDLQVPAAWI